MVNKEFSYLFDIGFIKAPIITQKTVDLIKENKYSFKVSPKANKTMIKDYIECLFDVKVLKINTCGRKRKKKRYGRRIGYTSEYKKAIVTLRKEDKIDIIPDL